jgi:hypothetical protein
LVDQVISTITMICGFLIQSVNHGQKSKLMGMMFLLN